MKKFSGLIAASILASGVAPASAEDVLAARNIQAGSILLAGDLVAPEGDLALRRAARLIGLEAARSIYRGQPISEKDLRAPTLIARNEIVAMEFERGPLLIATEGRALDQGGKGDRIRVMNLASKRVVTAVVVSSNKVRSVQ